MNIVIFGPPGAGKGTQSNFIVKKYKLYQLSTGELLRNEINNKSVLGNKIFSIINSGQLVSDKIYYDVSHNEDGIKSVLKNLNRMFPTSKLYGLLCLKGDKEIDCIAESIKSQFEMLFVSTSKDGLLMEPEKLSRELHNLKVDNLPSGDISSSISKIKKVRKPDDVILIFGSHYIANEIFSEFEISFDTGLI